MTQFFGAGVAIPINSFAKNPIKTVAQHADPVCGAIWGKASGFKFTTPGGDEATNPITGNVDDIKDIYVIRRGEEVLWIRDPDDNGEAGNDPSPNEGTIGDNNPDGSCPTGPGHSPPLIKQLPGYPGAGWKPAQPWTFYCGTFIEKSQESKKNGGVTEITPIETTVHLYVTWANAKRLFHWPVGDSCGVTDTVVRRFDHFGYPLMQTGLPYSLPIPHTQNLEGC